LFQQKPHPAAPFEHRAMGFFLARSAYGMPRAESAQLYPSAEMPAWIFCLEKSNRTNT